MKLKPKTLLNIFLILLTIAGLECLIAYAALINENRPLSVSEINSIPKLLEAGLATLPVGIVGLLIFNIKK